MISCPSGVRASHVRLRLFRLRVMWKVDQSGANRHMMLRR